MLKPVKWDTNFVRTGTFRGHIKISAKNPTADATLNSYCKNRLVWTRYFWKSFPPAQAPHLWAKGFNKKSCSKLNPC